MRKNEWMFQRIIFESGIVHIMDIPVVILDPKNITVSSFDLLVLDEVQKQTIHLQNN